MTLHKDKPAKLRLRDVFRFEPREKVAREVKHPWLVPLFIVVAIALIVGTIIWGMIAGVKYF